MRMSLRAAVAGAAAAVVALPVAATADQSVTITNPEEGGCTRCDGPSTPGKELGVAVPQRGPLLLSLIHI